MGTAMRTTSSRLWTVIGIALFVVTLKSAYAHHAIGAEYDTKKTIDLVGAIKELSFDNPHVFLRLQVDGKVWLVSLLSPAALKNHGLSRSDLPIGATLAVTGFPHRLHDEVYAQRITINGKATELAPR